MKKSFIFFSLFLTIFLFLIFISSFCWASENPYINFDLYGIDNIVTLDNSNGDFDNFEYCIILGTNGNYGFALSESPIYIDTSTQTASGYRTLKSSTGLYYKNGYQPNTLSSNYTFSELNHNSIGTLTYNTDQIIYSNSVIYTDSSLETASDIYTLDYNFYHTISAVDFSTTVGLLSETLSFNNVFTDFTAYVPFIAVVTLVAIGAYIINKQLNKSKKMR